MTVSRRKFVKAGAMMGLSGITVLKSAARVFGQHPGATQEGLFAVPVESQAETTPLTEMTFSAQVGTRFRIYTSPLTAISLELIKVTRREPPSKDQSDNDRSAKTPQLEGFSVVFRGPRRIPLQSRTYRVQHDQMGAFDLFITPVNDHKKQRFYEAVFNRVVQ